MNTEFNLEICARIIHAARYRSRRMAKRELYELGVESTGTALDQVLAMISAHPEAGEIAARSESLEAARLEQQRLSALDRVRAQGDVPEWLIGETTHWGRTFIIHFCMGGLDSFVGEIFDDAEEEPPGLEHHALDEGQVLSNITWLDGERPPDIRVRKLMKQARREIRIYDAQE